MRMMDASINLLQLPETKQLILDDPQLLLMRLQHPLTMVEEVRIGASCQRVSLVGVFVAAAIHSDCSSALHPGLL